MCGMGSWQIVLPLPRDDVMVFEDPTNWLLTIATALEVLFALGVLCALVFAGFWLRDRWRAQALRREAVLAPVRCEQTRALLASADLWQSEAGALFREEGRRALARMDAPVSWLELSLRSRVVECALRGGASWLRLFTPTRVWRRWIDVYLDSAVPRLQRHV